MGPLPQRQQTVAAQTPMGQEPAQTESSYLTREVYEQCNPSLGAAELGGYDPSTTLSGQCGKEDAELIRDALTNKQFDYQAVTPVPYIFPGFLQQAMASFPAELLDMSLKAHAQNLPADETLLAQFFTWGFPVPAKQLRRILGDAAVQALWRCRVVRPCAKQPSLWVGAVQLFPIPFTSVIVATDWPVLEFDMQEESVMPVTPQNMDLIFNAPPANGMQVLDMSSGNGVHGILAAKRGAGSVTFMNSSPRARRFTQFNSWLNRVGDQVRFIQGQTQLGDARFDLLLANPMYKPDMFDDGEEELREALKIASSFLGENGSFAFVSEIANPSDLPNHLCKDSLLEDFSGTVAFQTPTTTRFEYVVASTNVWDHENPMAATLSGIKRLQQLGVNQVSHSVVFGWRTPNAGYGCGEWDYVGLPGSVASQIDPEKPLELRPCFYNQHKRESCPHMF